MTERWVWRNIGYSASGALIAYFIGVPDIYKSVPPEWCMFVSSGVAYAIGSFGR